MSVYINKFREMKMKLNVIWFLFLIYVALARSFPAGNLPSNADPEQSEEKKFVNGTVVGSYTYKDKDGNPVQVKYFADDVNYGVELKSFKILSSSGKPHVPFYKDVKPFKAENTEKMDAEEDVSSNQKSNKKASDDLPNTGDKPVSDFETYYKNDVVEPSNKCGKGKVRVYYDKERRTRNAISNFESVKYCKRF